MNTITYRRLQLSDMPRFIQAKEIMSKATDEVTRTSIDDERGYFHQYYTDGVGMCLIAVNASEEIVSTAAIIRHPYDTTDLRIWRVGTVPAYQGQGIATHLIRALVEYAVSRRDEYKTVSLTVNIHNEVAKRIYRRIGFIEMSEIVVDDHTSCLMKILL